MATLCNRHSLHIRYSVSLGQTLLSENIFSKYNELKLFFEVF